MIEPHEKNLKDKNDPISWDHVPHGRFEMSFRPPEAESLQLSLPNVFYRLLRISAFAVIAIPFVFFCFGIGLAFLIGFVPIGIALIVLCIMARGIYERFREQIIEHANVAIWLVVAVVAYCYLAHHLSTFAMGMLIYIVAIPQVLFIADQMTGHMVFWHSAHPSIERNEMVRWRNAWHHRFCSPTTTGIQQASLYVFRHLLVVGVYAGSIIGAMTLSRAMTTEQTGLLIVMLGSLLLFVATAVAGISVRRINELSLAMGHWFEYLPEERQPPSVLQSPAGSHAKRRLLLIVATATMAVGIATLVQAELHLLDSHLDNLLADQSPSMIRAAVLGAVLAPMHVLLIWVAITAPTATVCATAIKKRGQ